MDFWTRGTTDGNHTVVATTSWLRPCWGAIEIRFVMKMKKGTRLYCDVKSSAYTLEPNNERFVEIEYVEHLSDIIIPVCIPIVNRVSLKKLSGYIAEGNLVVVYANIREPYNTLPGNQSHLLHYDVNQYKRTGTLPYVKGVRTALFELYGQLSPIVRNSLEITTVECAEWQFTDDHTPPIYERYTIDEYLFIEGADSLSGP